MPAPSENPVPGTTAKRIGVACALLLIAAVVFYTPTRWRDSAWTAAQKPVTLAEVSRTNLVLTEGRLRLAGQQDGFTGLMVEHHAHGVLRSRSAISNGLLHGLSEGWYTNGQLQVTEHFKDGVSHGLRTKWSATGARVSEASIVDGKLHGPFKRWHPDGSLAEWVDLKQGQPDGLSRAYYPGGALKAEARLEGGKVIEKRFWKEGEHRAANPDGNGSLTVSRR